MEEESILSTIKVDLLPSGELGQVLITERISSLRGAGYAIEVPLLNAQETKDLLRKRCPYFQLHEVDEVTLASLLGHLPLAIEQAEMYTEVNSMQVPEYLQELSGPLTSKASLLGESLASPYSRPLLRTWEIIVARTSQDANMLLNIPVFLRPDGVGEDFFKISTDHKPNSLWSRTNSLQDLIEEFVCRTIMPMCWLHPRFSEQPSTVL